MVTPSASTAADRRPGRPRSKSVDDAILDAAIALIAERGSRDTSMEAIAARAHAGKDTIYRRWRHKDQLLEAVVARVADVRPEVPHTGTLREDLAAYLSRLEDLLAGPVLGPVLAAAIGQAPHDPGQHRLLRAHRAEVDRDIERILRAAAARGEILPSDRSLAAMVTLLVAPCYLDWLLSEAPSMRMRWADLIDAVIHVSDTGAA